MKRDHCTYGLLLAVLLAGCGADVNDDIPSDPLFVSLEAGASGVDFVNTVEDGEEFNVLSYRNFYNGGGVAIGDLNGDGMDDLYFTANQGPNRLYLNRGDLRFEEVDGGLAAGRMAWSTGVTVVDVNADGKLDLYVCNSGNPDGSQRANELFVNQGNDAGGNPTFSEEADAYGLADEGFSTQAAWLDYDKDGDLDVYLLNNSYLSPERINPNGENRNVRDAAGGDKLLRNDGGRFVDVSEEAGIYGSRIGFGLGNGLGDVNGDGWTDIYVSNDFWERDYLYINNQDGTFSEQLMDRIDHVSISSMGSDVGDLDNDGDPEIFTTDMLAADNQRLKAATLFDTYNREAIKYEKDYHHQILQNCLQLNDGNGHFTEVGHYAGVSATDWSWGALIFDMDNDGLQDIFVANGIYRDIMDLDFADFIADRDNVKEIVEQTGRFDWRDVVQRLPHNAQPNYAFLNRGKLRFENMAGPLGLGTPGYSNGAAYGDLDGDGDLELVVNNVNQPAAIYKNTSTERGSNHVTVALRGTTANPLGTGAEIVVTAGELRQTRQQYTSRGFVSSVAPDLVFGLGDYTGTVDIRVEWPDGKENFLEGVEINEVHTVKHTDARPANRVAQGSADESAYFTSANQLLDVPAVHVEPFHNDFDHESLLHRKLSDPGPGVVVGDVNGDGLQDFVALGSLGDPDKLYQQRADGTFKRVQNDFLDLTAKYESSCGAFFDVDGDGDQDLMVGTGGNDFTREYMTYAVRYYENIDGLLVYNQVLAPNAGGEVSCIVPEDIDFDGDIDLFIGQRAVPGNYGLIPQSFLMIREKGTWVKQTPQDIATAGMVTDAVWADVNVDGRPDLVMVGDWMPVTVAFMLNDGKISEIFEVPNSSGFWNSIDKADLDGDGREDLILGNWGLNGKFRASAEKPLRLHTNDFDRNQKSEFIIEWYTPDGDGPHFFGSKREMHGQLPHLRKKTLKYQDFAAATYESLFTAEEREGTIERDAKELRSCVFWNEGEGRFFIKPLPWQTQLTSQHAIAIEDVNGDGKPDVWLGGNEYGLSPQVGRLDAGRGSLLLNSGDRNFEYVDPATAGISVAGQVRDAQFIELADGGKALLVGCNDAPLRVYKVQEDVSR